MDHKKTAVFGTYASATAAERAVDALMQAGFSDRAMSVRLPDQHGTKAPASVGGAPGLLAGIGALALPEVPPRYEEHLKGDDVLLSVVCDSAQGTVVTGILTGTGAGHISPETPQLMTVSS